ncbi:hypothetical protein CDL12_28337 [Handroanthus impetiginosus]|uniref:DUF7722 domain-containing protein n=1 Tax=Handroanthus impetiginosus TaxID=429701 RepID=A0A2G9G1I0_9LAMI|nr:hypothetical protein CDL12_28336 [Handroanthus impetiginosus]PIM99173.1 hypothetical protein CDL12_28337 [Handroanthus impetiginosus]
MRPLKWLLSYPHAIFLNHSSPDGGSTPCDARTVSAPSGGISRDRPEKRQAMEKFGFQMPLHYPRYKRSDYEKMEEWQVDMLLREYGLSVEGNLEEKRRFAMGAFLWPDQF